MSRIKKYLPMGRAGLVWSRWGWWWPTTTAARLARTRAGARPRATGPRIWSTLTAVRPGP